MIKDPTGIVVPHPTEYIVMIGDEVLSISKRIAYTRVATFVHKSHAEAFARSIKSYHTAVIEPEVNPNELIIRIHPEGWDA